MEQQEDWVAFDTRDTSRFVSVPAGNWSEAREKGRKKLRIPIEFTNAATRTTGMIDHDYAPRTGVRKKSR